MPARIPMTERQRAELLALPVTEEEVVVRYSLDDLELKAVARLWFPANRLGYALQLCCLRYPGRYLRRGEMLPAAMLDYIAEQIDVDADVIAEFARRGPTLYEQLAVIKRNHAFQDLTHPLRAKLGAWLEDEAATLVDARLLLKRLVDGGGVSDIVFCVMSMLGLNFEPRIPCLSDRKLYAFEPRARYGKLAPLFGHRLDENLIRSHWDDIHQVITAMRNRVVTPSLILKKLSAYRQQNSLAAAMREIGRIERTLFTLRWFDDPELRTLVTAELNKGEARNTLARAVAFHRLGRFRDRGTENQQVRAAARNLVTAAMILFNCRYLGCAGNALRGYGTSGVEEALGQISPLGWDHINLTGDYVFSDNAQLDSDGFLPLKFAQEWRLMAIGNLTGDRLLPTTFLPLGSEIAIG